MADIKQLENALVKADAAGNVEDARALAAEIRRMREPAQAPAPKEQGVFDGPIVDYDRPRRVLKATGEGLRDFYAGGIRGAGSIGATLLRPFESSEENAQRRANIDYGLRELVGANPESIAYQGGKLATEIAGTSGVGGALGKGVQVVSKAPFAARLAQALQSGGMTTGGQRTLGDMLLRMGAGATTGGASAALVDPEYAKTGAIVGGALPGATALAGAVGSYGVRVVNSLTAPFTQRGQERIAGDVIRKFAGGAPVTQNAAELVPGSVPTLAESTGNAGIAGLQRAMRDVKPNAFAEREAANAAARVRAFDEIAGDTGQLSALKADRAETGKGLYDLALDQSNMKEVTPYIKGQITQLLKRPSINQASKEAQKLAMERGEKPAAQGSLRALHDVKTILDDKISVAVREGKGGEAKALQNTKDILLGAMEKLSPTYAEARTAYAKMSQPINAMETLQGLKITDAQGNITLAKVKNALDGLKKQIGSAGSNPAKSLTADQIGVLESIHDDLLRQAALSKGKSVGSNTFQNIATDEILSAALPGKLGGFAKDKAGGIVGQAGRLLYSGPNEAIRNRIADMLLNPELAQSAMQQPAIQANTTNAIADILRQSAYRAAPLVPSTISGQ